MYTESSLVLLNVEASDASERRGRALHVACTEPEHRDHISCDDRKMNATLTAEAGSVKPEQAMQVSKSPSSHHLLCEPAI